MTTLIKHRDQCDFTCFELVMLGGSAVPAGLLAELQVYCLLIDNLTDIVMDSLLFLLLMVATRLEPVSLLL